jgi:hypothetical protein
MTLRCLLGYAEYCLLGYAEYCLLGYAEYCLLGYAEYCLLGYGKLYYDARLPAKLAFSSSTFFEY